MATYIIKADEDEVKMFKTKEDWDADPLSPAGEYVAHNYGIGTRTTAGPIEKYMNEPYKFPCLGIFSFFAVPNCNGPDLIPIMFIYDFEEVKEAE